MPGGVRAKFGIDGDLKSDTFTLVHQFPIYYRVKIYSHSSLYSISKVVMISSKSNITHSYILSVVQNGSKTNAVMNFYSQSNGSVSLNIVDVDGKILFKTQAETSA